MSEKGPVRAVVFKRDDLETVSAASVRIDRTRISSERPAVPRLWTHQEL